MEPKPMSCEGRCARAYAAMMRRMAEYAASPDPAERAAAAYWAPAAHAAEAAAMAAAKSTPEDAYCYAHMGGGMYA